MSDGNESQSAELPRSGRASDDYQEVPGGSETGKANTPQRSGIVTAIGVVAVVLGGSYMMNGLCAGVASALIPLVQDVFRQQPIDPGVRQMVEQLTRIPIWYLLVGGGFDLVDGTGLLVGGIGVIKRSGTGRLLTLSMATLTAIASAGMISIALAMGFLGPQNLMASSLGLIVACGFALWAYVVLLRSRNSIEFRAPMPVADRRRG
jgi:hypothetical protein